MVHSLSRSHFSQCSGKGSPSTVTEILGVTRQALYNRIRGCTNPVTFSDLHFDSAIWSITERYSNDVEVLVGGHLTRGKRVPHARLRATDPEHDLHQKMSPVDSLQRSDVCKARFAGLPCATYGLRLMMSHSTHTMHA